MDITTTTPSQPSAEAKSETPPGIHPIKPLFFTNKRHAPPPGGGAFAYKECLKNHAATLGGHALDGCGEFLPSPTASPADPTSLTCAACSCHRNFHRREADDPSPPPVIEYRPHHRHHAPPVGAARGSQSPPPISSSYYPHMLLALSEPGRTGPVNPNRKRFRTKFSQEQREKMQGFAEKLGWKMQKVNDDMVKKFCGEIGVERGVFKVWMHNNKNTFVAKRFASSADHPSTTERNGNGNGDGNSHSSSIEQQDNHHHHHNHHNESNAAANASSSSS